MCVHVAPKGSEHLLHVDPELEGEEKDSVTLLNEILGSMSVDEGDFSREWTEVFGEAEDGGATAGGRPDPQEQNSFFLPSQLLDQSLSDPLSSMAGEKLFLLLLENYFNMSVNFSADGSVIFCVCPFHPALVHLFPAHRAQVQIVNQCV